MTARPGEPRNEEEATMDFDSVDALERGRILASERDDLITQGVDPDQLLVPLAPNGRCPEVLHCHEFVGHDGPHRAVAVRDSVHEWRTASGFSADAMDWTPDE